MSLLNRPVEFHHLYDSEGRLQGGLSALEELASVIAMNASNDRSQDDISDEEESEVKPARDFPVRTVTQDSPSLDSDEDMDEPGSSDEEMEEIAMYDEPFSSSSTAAESPGASISVETASISSTGSSSSGGTISNSGSSPSTPMDGRPSRRQSMRSIGSRRSSRRRKDTMDQSIEVKLPIGEQLKKQFLEMNLFSTLLVSPLPFAPTSG
jgi:serine/threonine-protein phosphatase 6 regulatory subunit 3